MDDLEEEKKHLPLESNLDKTDLQREECKRLILFSDKKISISKE